jgi:hypothetical protein
METLTAFTPEMTETHLPKIMSTKRDHQHIDTFIQDLQVSYKSGFSVFNSNCWFIVSGRTCFDPQPVGFWPLSEASGFHDDSGYGNHARGSDVTLTSGPSKLANTAYEFHGRDTSFLKIARAPVLDLGAKGSFSYSAFIYLTKTTGSLMEWNPIPKYYGLHFWISSSTGEFLKVVIPDYTTHDNVNIINENHIPAVPLKRNTWQFVAVSYDFQNGKITIKVDSTVESMTVSKIRPRTNGNIPFIYIGRRVRYDYLSESLFKGKMSCVMLFNQTLTTDQLEEARKYCLSLDTERARKTVGSSMQCR